MEYYRYAKPDGKVALRFGAIFKNDFFKTANQKFMRFRWWNVFWLYVQSGPNVTLVILRRKSILLWWRHARKTIYIFSFPVTLIFDLLVLELNHHSRTVTSSKYELSTTFQYWVDERSVTDRQTDRQITITQNNVFVWWNVFDCVEWAVGHFGLGLSMVW